MNYRRSSASRRRGSGRALATAECVAAAFVYEGIKPYNAIKLAEIWRSLPDYNWDEFDK